VHSAIKIGGKRAYELARSGAEVDITERTVTIYEKATLGWTGQVLTLLINCSKGTYIRSIARDLGTDLGSGAYLSNLVRTRSGPYCLADAWTLTELELIDPREEWSSIAEHPDSALRDWPAIVMGECDSRDWQFGRPIPNLNTDHSSRARVYDNIGHWCGLAEKDQERNVWRALKVINPW
jgi:tRNA pseudouridine55 synthase